MKNRVIWKVALSLTCAAGLMLAQQDAQQPPATQQPPAAQPPESTSPVQKQPSVKSPEEGKAVMAMFQALTPDGRIKAAEELLTKFADTEFKPVALQFIAASYQQKGDYENMIVYAERTLQADPNNYMAMLMLAQGIAQRTREFDLDREEKLARAEKYANQALEILKTAPRPNPALTDEQWEGHKNDFCSQAYEALGMVAMVRKNYDQAINEYKKSIEVAMNQDPVTSIRLASAYEKAGKYDEAISLLDKILADASVNTQIKQFAQAEKVRATQAKQGGADKPAAPSAPAQGEIKKQ
jgi:tetratricopeptide (TPR) repeat protein